MDMVWVGWAVLAALFAALVLLGRPLGLYMAALADGRMPKRLLGVESRLLRLCGVRPDEEMGWGDYARVRSSLTATDTRRVPRQPCARSAREPRHHLREMCKGHRPARAYRAASVAFLKKFDTASMRQGNVFTRRLRQSSYDFGGFSSKGLLQWI